jgi:hypothetical protein
MVQKILILAANPKTTLPLRLDQEMREIDEGLRRSKNREHFVLEKRLAVRTEDLRRALLDEDPYFVHFCGHGLGEEGILLEDVVGYPQLVKAEPLANLFKLFSERVECIILNACYSEIQATAISQYIKYVIGMKQAIGDKAAIEFATGFYDAIGAGRTIEDAFEFGKSAISLNGIPEELTPVIKRKSVITLQQSHQETLQPQSAELSNSQPNVSELQISTSVPSEENKNEKTLPETEEEPELNSQLQPFTRRQLVLSIAGLTILASTGTIFSYARADKPNLLEVPPSLLNLRELLQKKKWKEANLETLRVTLEAVNRKGEKLLRREDIAIFPCDLLRTIDQLWVEASDGKFGFSTQAKVYRSCGGKADGKHDKEIWKRFSSEVEWYVNGEWVDWRTIVVVDSDPIGYLPCWWAPTRSLAFDGNGFDVPLWCAGPQVLLCIPKYYLLDDQTNHVWIGWMAALVLRLSECGIV